MAKERGLGSVNIFLKKTDSDTDHQFISSEIHLLSKKLDTKTYSEYKEARKNPRDLQSFDEFMSFLEQKFTALEPIHQHVQEKEKTLPPSPSPKKYPNQLNPNRANKLFTNYSNQGKSSKPFYQTNIVNTRKCTLCNHEHELYRCKHFLELTPENKLRAISKHKVCVNCLYKHFDNACTSTKRCKECRGDHNTILHEACTKLLSLPKINSISPPPPLENTSYQGKQHTVNHVAGVGEEILLTTLKLKVRAADGTYVTLNALCDQGSQTTLLTQAAAQTLGLKRHPYHASVSGIGTGTRQSKGLVTIECQSIYDDYNFDTNALVLSKIINNNLPNTNISKQAWPHLQHIKLADPEYYISKPIDILLDASVYSDIIMSGLIKGPADAPIAQQTKLGWILSGNVKHVHFNCHVVINDLAEISRFWEIEDVESTSSVMSEQDKYCEDFYQATTKRLESGRYEVGLPMKPCFEQHLGSSKSKAIAQLKQLEHKMSKNEDFAESYKAFLDEYEKLGHMRLVSTTTTQPICYLPHHGVWKMDSNTTKLRVVFNASSRTSTGSSLNQLMESGPNLQADLQKLILAWRTYKYVITADAEKYFRQIVIRKMDQPLQSIVWRKSPQVPIEEYNLTTVTYGTKAAPFLAIRTLRQLARDDRDKYPLAAHALENSFYMDDLLSGHNLLDQAKNLQNQLIEILKGAGIKLRKWSSNYSEIIKHLPSDQVDSPLDFKCSETRKTLGLRWNPSSDTFTFHNKMECESNKRGQTKRQLLSDISKIFDPLGWLSPLSIRAKLLFQKAWSSGMSWDEAVSTEISEEWNQLRNDFQYISALSINRHYGNTDQNYQLHGFCDATPKCYACTIFVVTRNNKGELTSRLVAAKTRLAPLNKQISLPRLELCSAHLLSQLMHKVIETLPREQCKVYAWTDSMIVLGWLQGDVSRWKQFVANRVQKILLIIPAAKWHHVRSEENAADCATRGLTTKQLSDYSLWWQGPEWLIKDEPPLEIKYPEPSIESKKQKSTVAVAMKLSVATSDEFKQAELSIIKQLMYEHSSITFVAKVIACITRFITRSTDKQNATTSKASRASEINNALNLIIKHYQMDEFKEDINSIRKKGRVQVKSNLACLNPFLDEEGILRVGGRLKHSNISIAAKHPIILSSHSRLTELIIKQAHMTTLHGGPKLTLTYIRDKFWIICGIRTVKKQLRQCVICRRASSETQQQIMADLPSPRVRPSRPFTHCGVDFTGHVYLKANKGRGIRTTKGYVAVFVCLATKAVHLELVSDLTTPAFLAAFHRFRARRATPQHMYSDNGTNFVGCNRLLKKEYQEIMQSLDKDLFNRIEEMNIEWHFNCPSHSNAGGIWESVVKSLKRHLKRVLGEQKLTFEEFTTLLCQIEACLNSRPLCALTESTDDDCLTPGHFLVGGSLLSRPQTDAVSINLGMRWQLVQAMNKQFWKTWSSEYLQQLQIRSKWRTSQKNLQVDDVVVIKDDNMAPGKFALGKVLELHPGSDGFVRIVTLKTHGNILKRPVNKLILLPVHESDEVRNHQTLKQSENQSSSSTTTPQAPQKLTTIPTRRRRTKKPCINMLSTILFLFMSLFTSSIQQDFNASYNITSLSDNQGLYFDKISNLQFIRDQWKLVVYYNMSTYWQGIQDIKQYVNHIKEFSTGSNSQYESVALQLEHEISEIEHYNSLLRAHSRRKRGLINGVGYIANSLFGVLDERFAKQYELDINKIAGNENHLQSLIRNQTIILESESNIVRRNENIMNKQLSFIRQRLLNVSSEVNEVRLDYNNVNYITSSSLAASIILTNIRNIQQSLINTVTDISQGHIDTRLLTPEQLENQINKISSQLQADLVLPIEKTSIHSLYKLLRVFTRVLNNLLIIEINIPLLSKELYELHKIISIPLTKGMKSFYVYPILPYLAFDLRKDMGMLLSESDLQSCLHTSMDRTLCSLAKPIHDMKFRQSLCDVSACTSELLPTCKVRWVKLHYHNEWLYSCCEQCSVRIFCPSVVNVITLKGNGIITIGQGCTIKANTFVIYAQNNFQNNVHLQQNIRVPEVSMLNKIINSSLGIENNTTFLHSKDDMWDQLKAKIDYLKEQSTQQLSVHDKHHYILIYVISFIILATGTVGIYWKIKKRSKDTPTAPPPEASSARNDTNSVSEVDAQLDLQVLREGKSMSSVNKATSPIVCRSKNFEL